MFVHLIYGLINFLANYCFFFHLKVFVMVERQKVIKLVYSKSNEAQLMLSLTGVAATAPASSSDMVGG